MSDLNFSQSADPVALYNDQTGNELAINADGSINVVQSGASSITDYLHGINLELNLGSTGVQNMLLLRNPSGSGKNLYLNKIVYAILGSATRYRIGIYQKPTVTATGTGLTIYSHNIKSSPPATVCNAYSAPTTSSLGTKIRTYSIEGTGSGLELFGYGFKLEENNDILIVGDTDATNKVVCVSLEWTEV
jgi:hypothetical protein